MSGPFEVALLHRVAPPDAADPEVIRAATLEAGCLEAYLEARRGRRRVRPDELVSGGTEGGFLLTFDDGDRTVRETALPLIERYEAHAIVFVTTGFIDGERPYEWVLAEWLEALSSVRVDGAIQALGDREARAQALRQLTEPLYGLSTGARREALERFAIDHDVSWPVGRDPRFLSWDEVRELATHPLVTIGAHSCTHPRLDALSPRRAWPELRGARRRIEREIERRVDWLAYPYGGHGRATVWLSRLAGYRAAFTTRPGRWDGRRDRFRIPRNEVRA